MKEYTVLKYLLSTIKNGYINYMDVTDVKEDCIHIILYTDSEFKIQPIKMMIEANVYVNKSLEAEHIEFKDDKMTIKCFNNVTYNIGIKVMKRRQRF